MTTPKMTRVTVRVPSATLEQINDWVDTLGVRRSHFLGIALVAGARALIRASALQVSDETEHPSPLGAAAPADANPRTEGVDVSSNDPLAHGQAIAAAIAELRAEVAALRERLGGRPQAGAPGAREFRGNETKRQSVKGDHHGDERQAQGEKEQETQEGQDGILTP